MNHSNFKQDCLKLLFATLCFSGANFFPITAIVLGKIELFTLPMFCFVALGNALLFTTLIKFFNKLDEETE